MSEGVGTHHKGRHYDSIDLVKVGAGKGVWDTVLTYRKEHIKHPIQSFMFDYYY